MSVKVWRVAYRWSRSGEKRYVTAPGSDAPALFTADEARNEIRARLLRGGYWHLWAEEAA